MCRERKEKWLGEICEEVDQLKKVYSRKIAEKIKEITGVQRTSTSTIIKDDKIMTIKDGNNNGIILMQREEVLKMWEDSVAELYGATRGERQEFEDI